MKPCDCLQCRLRRLALSESRDDSEAIDHLTVVIGRMLAGFDDDTIQTVTDGLIRSRAFYRQQRPGADTIGEVSGHA